ncbi:flippase [Natronorarus salvus]|uniref:flippase n=1 Tax=Natronorarus salvus TaxID=3117733 RepID=UPI002F263139
MAPSDGAIEGLKATLVADIVRVVVQGALVIVLVRLFLTPGEYGLLFLAISVFSVALLFGQLGFPKSAARYVAEYRETDPGQVPHIVRVSMGYNAVTVGITAIVVAAASGPIARAIGEPALAPFLLLGFGYIVFSALNGYLHLVFQGFNRVDLSAIVVVVTNLGTLGFVLGLVAVGFGALGALFGYIAGYAVASVVGLVMLHRTLSAYERAPAIGYDLPRRIAEYSVPLTVTRSANVLYKRVDLVLIGFFLTPVAVGYYTLAKQIADFVMAPAQALGFTVSPTYGERKAGEQLESAARLYESTFEGICLLYLPGIVGLVLVAEPMVRHVFGTAYLGAVPAIQVLSGFVLFQAIDKITNDGLDYLGRARARAIAKGATGVLNFVLSLLLIPVVGIVGAAAATVFSFGLMVAFNVYVIHTELGLDLARMARSLAHVSLIALAMGAVVWLSVPLATNILALFAVVGLGLLVWLVAASFFGMVDPREPMTLIS